MPSSNITPSTEPGFLRQAESAWLDGDFSSSTKALAAKAGSTPNFVLESAFDPGALPNGITAEPLVLGGRSLSSHLVRIEQGLAVFDIGVPLLHDGTFYSQAFAHLKYPERYAHLFSEAAGQALAEAARSNHHVANAYVTLIRPPYYHWLLDTIPHLYGASRLQHLDQVKLIAPDTMTFHPWQKALLEKASGAFGIKNLAYLPTNGTAVAIRSSYSQTRMSLPERWSLLRLIAPSVSPKKPWRFLYSRRGTKDVRRLTNEDALIAALGGKFTVIDPSDLDLDTQMSLFAEARCVVGVHGSNLANIAFCRAGTTVVEIAAGLSQPHFERLAEAADLEFVRVEASPATLETHEKTWAQAHGDLTVNPADVIQAVDVGLAAATSP
jgi:hypothetical protein